MTVSLPNRFQVRLSLGLKRRHPHDCVPCFKDAAAKDELGREIGLYIYYGEGDQDGVYEHENVAPGAYAYVNGYPVYENGKTVFKYMIGIDAESFGR